MEPGTAAVIFQIRQRTSMRSVTPFRASLPSRTAAFHMARGTSRSVLHVLHFYRVTGGYHFGCVQGVKDLKESKTKEVNDGIYLS